MYGKLFASMYDGTLYGQWQAIVTLQQLVILADEDGVVDMTPPAIAAKTSIPLDIIQSGLSSLAEADQYSRSAAKEGRRIVLIDEARPWGWVIVNYPYYRDLANKEDKKRKDRERIAEKRNEISNVAKCRKVSQSVADVAYVDVNVNIDTEAKPARKRAAFVSPSVDEVRAYCAERQNSVDPEQFVAHYRSNGWKVGGKAAMKDWKASVITWEKNNFGKPATAEPKIKLLRDAG